MDTQFKSTEQLIAFIGNTLFNSLIPSKFSGEEGLSQLFCFTLSGYCKDVNLVLDTLLHQAVAVKVNYQQQQRYFHGIVAEIIDEGVTGHTLRRFSLTLRPQIWFLNLTKASQLFQQQTVPEIIRGILQMQQIISVDMQALTQQYLPKSYCAQYDESYLTFIFRLMEEVGIEYYFTFSDKQHTLHFIDNLGLLPQIAQTLNFNNTQQDESYIHDWEQRFYLTSNQAGLNDYNYESPTLNLTTQLQSSNSVKIAGISAVIEKYQYPGGYQDLSTGQKKVSLALQREISHQELIFGASNVLTFAGGLRFQFDCAEDASQNGQYFLIKVTHDFEHASQLNVITTEKNPPAQSYKNQFTACSSLLRYSTPVQHQKSIINGFHNAIVSSASEKSIDTDNLGRIKVQFLWDESNKVSPWIRVSQQQVGVGWGTHFLPRVGQEVLIQYIDGDIDRPICIGSHYNAMQKPPYSVPEQQHLSGIKTQSVGQGDPDKGHEMQFNDLPEKENIRLVAQNQLIETIKNDANYSVGNAEKINISGKQQTQIGGNATYQSPKSIRFVAAGNSIEITPNHISIQGQYIDTAS